MDDVKASMFHVSDMCLQSWIGGKNLESIQSSTTPDPGYRMGKWKIHTKKHQTYEIQEVSIFTAGDHKAEWHRQDNIAKTNTNKKDPQKKYHLGMVSKKITGGLKLVSRYQPHT